MGVFCGASVWRRPVHSDELVARKIEVLESQKDFHMRHGTLLLGLAGSKGRVTLDRLRWLAITLAITAIPKITFATSEELPATLVTIQFKGRGAVHVFQ